MVNIRLNPKYPAGGYHMNGLILSAWNDNAMEGNYTHKDPNHPLPDLIRWDPLGNFFNNSFLLAFTGYSLTYTVDSSE